MMASIRSRARDYSVFSSHEKQKSIPSIIKSFGKVVRLINPPKLKATKNRDYFKSVGDAFGKGHRLLPRNEEETVRGGVSVLANRSRRWVGPAR
jgi:hypothetical protein